MARFLIGVDEAGRGPLAGPVAVGVVMVPARFDIKKHFPGVDDSKQLSEEKREELYTLILSFTRMSKLRFLVVFSSHQIIDTWGISLAVRRGVYKGVSRLAPEPRGVRVLLDGLLQAPPNYEQKTIVRGDESEPVISLASIAAKVERDRLMKRAAKKYPQYGFEQHKGYGTKAHYEAIEEHGLCDIHRKSWIIAGVDNRVDL